MVKIHTYTYSACTWHARLFHAAVKCCINRTHTWKVNAHSQTNVTGHEMLHQCTWIHVFIHNVIACKFYAKETYATSTCTCKKYVRADRRHTSIRQKYTRAVRSNASHVTTSRNGGNVTSSPNAGNVTASLIHLWTQVNVTTHIENVTKSKSSSLYLQHACIRTFGAAMSSYSYAVQQEMWHYIYIYIYIYI